MPRPLTRRERDVLRYRGQPAATVSVALRMRVHEVLEIRAQLRARGIGPRAAELSDQQQLFPDAA